MILIKILRRFIKDSSKIPRGILRGTLEKTESKFVPEILRGASVDPQWFQIGILERFQIFHFNLLRYTSEVLQSYLRDTSDHLRDTSATLWMILELPQRLLSSLHVHPQSLLFESISTIIHQVTSKGKQNVGGVDGTRTRDPRRDKPVF